MDGFYDIRGVGEITTIDDFKEAVEMPLRN
jgi:hypothetical protein